MRITELEDLPPLFNQIYHTVRCTETHLNNLIHMAELCTAILIFLLVKTELINIQY